MTRQQQMIAANTAEQAEEMARDQAQHSGLQVSSVEVVRGENGMWAVDRDDTGVTALPSSTDA